MKKINTKRLPIVILSVTTAILLIAVIVLTCVLIKKFKDPNYGLASHEQYYNNKCASYSFQNFNLSKGQIVFLGDSITDLYPLDDYYQDLPLATYNRGIGGDSTQGVINRLQVSVFDLAPKAVVLLIGTNDVNGGIEEREILNNYETIISKIYEVLPSVKLYCVSIIPQNDDLESYSSINVTNTTAKILAINPKIQSLATSRGATYINLFPLLADENNRLIKTYSDDGIHLNANGFAVWTNLLKPYLEQL